MLSNLKRLGEARKTLIETLELWEHAKSHGYPCDIIAAFTFRPKFLTRAEAKKLCRQSSRLPCDTHFNCVRLRSGELEEIPLFRRPGCSEQPTT